MIKSDIYQDVTDRIIKSLESGTAPWLKSWDSEGNTLELGMPFNRTSKKAYRGINTLLLWIEKADQGFASDCWLTYKQAVDLGGNVRKGEKGTGIVFFKAVGEKQDSAGDKVKGFAFAKRYTVFNLDQCDGVDALAQPKPAAPTGDSVMMAIAETIGANVQFGGNPCFIPSIDVIRMPQSSDFKTLHHFEATLAHELTHWTGHKSRLARDMASRFGDEAYAAEELVAEIGAAFMSARLGFDHDEMRHDGYIASWLKVLRGDKKAVFTASSLAQKAVDLIDELQEVEQVAA